MKKIYILFIPVLFLFIINSAICQNTTSRNNDQLFTTGWQVIPSGVEENLLSVHFANPTHGFIGGALTRCMKSTDGGLIWSPVAIPSYADFDAVWAVSSNDVYVGGWDTIYATHNGGQSWQGAYTQTINYAIHDLHFLSPDDGFAFMTWAQFAKTTDAGNSWTLAPGGGFIAWDFFGGFMLDQNTGYAVGDNQVLCKTTDGGENFLVYEWNNYSDFTGIRIWGVSAPSDLVAVAVADSGVVFRTTDGGNYWSRSTIAGPEDNLTDVYFLNSTLGYIVGYNGKVFMTTDAGENWTQEPVVTSNNLNSVYFYSDKLGWAVGDNGTILRFEGTNSISPDVSQAEADLTISPNPVSGESIINFNLGIKENVSIDIYDISGRKLQNVFSGSLSQGFHSIKMTLSHLMAGTYYCRLTTQGKHSSVPFVISQ
jgi:photosystem II stability/assembly factor-like uncharacterized protein